MKDMPTKESLLIHMYDRQPEREEEVLDKMRKHFEHFVTVYAEESLSN